MLAKLASHYWRPDFSPGQAAAMTADYAEDLADCTLPEIEVAVREYRRNEANVFFPKSAQLRAIVSSNRKHRAEVERLGPPVAHLGSRPHCWWMQARQLWQHGWLESEVPPGQKVRDQGGVLREPERAA